MSFGPWHAPATNTPSVMVATGSSLGCRSVNQPSALQRDAAFQAHFLGVGLRLQRRHQDHHVDRHAPLSCPTACLHTWTISLPCFRRDSAATSVTSATLPRMKCIPSCNSR